MGVLTFSHLVVHYLDVCSCCRFFLGCRRSFDNSSSSVVQVIRSLLDSSSEPQHQKTVKRILVIRILWASLSALVLRLYCLYVFSSMSSTYSRRGRHLCVGPTKKIPAECRNESRTTMTAPPRSTTTAPHNNTYVAADVKQQQRLSTIRNKNIGEH